MNTREFEIEISRRGFIKVAACTAAIALGACGKENLEIEQKEVVSTIYGIGEVESEDNDFISNVPSAWDKNTVETFGGVDPLDPENNPRDFVPRHNTYYFALPASEFDENGLIPGARERSPWANERVGEGESLFKGRWIKVSRGDNVIFAQWHDVGPNEEQDYDYVFGDDKPANTFGMQAGLDLSPDAAKDLGITLEIGGAEVIWEFVNENEVPDGPWRKYPPIDNKTRWE